MYTQRANPRTGIAQAMLPSGGGGGTGRGAQSAKTLTLSDVYSLVVKLDARLAAQEKKLVAQDEKITVLQRENSELWQEIHRLKGPRFPLEIFLSIVDFARDDRETLKTFSLVCKSWMPITRDVLFAKISLHAAFWCVKIQPGPILNSPHCTVFPYIRTISINGSLDDGSSDPNAFRNPWWMEAFLVHMPKLTALTSLELISLIPWDLDCIERAMVPSKKRQIRALDIHSPEFFTISQIAVFISKFPELTTLVCGEMYEYWKADALRDLLGANEPLVAPPSSIRKLVLDATDLSHLPSTILKWFTDLHLGVIESFVAGNLPASHPAECRAFVGRFGVHLSHTVLSIHGCDDAFDSWTRNILPCSVSSNSSGSRLMSVQYITFRGRFGSYPQASKT
ncbi:hypothetical protein C8R47DRAFT_84028 [Mycena vitilis]|nr:hypothetical protein C8R47DRAFT_84028 [Mycena vitilis]